ncbi:isochorismatase family protein [Streptomyces liangshanensis]|uniref:Isochorismatase family protein n=1 Tax=Streptomyces liangshanensis TaxID=2717324 RepID=A0A6G9GSJ8_9ACTN|nr:isochorismatase family protein [Streptomyces liangshanensis]QIQ01218.1 isochorismatase family protein [Streptomyces liangshanensis]
MSDRSKFLEFLTADNAAVVMVDHQVGLYSGVRDTGLLELKHNVSALARAARALGVPIVVTTTAADSMWGPLVPELADALPEGTDVIDRSSVNAWRDSRVRARIEATGRRKLIFTGISLEVCAALPALAATADGYDTYVAVDASGTFSQTKREAGIARLQQAGVIVSDYATLMVEILDDNASPAAGEVYAALDMPFAVLVGQMSAAYAKNT